MDWTDIGSVSVCLSGPSQPLPAAQARAPAPPRVGRRHDQTGREKKDNSGEARARDQKTMDLDFGK